MLQEVHDQADVVIDTSDLSGRQLRERIFAALQPDEEAEHIAIQLISFGYKYGLPLEADLVFDVRFMVNPYYEPELRAQSGLAEPVRTFVLGQPAAQRFLAFVHDFLAFAIPAYESEGKNAPDDRHRLHRRLPPLDHHRRGHGGRPAAAGTAR